jgi:hypothetical protein
MAVGDNTFRAMSIAYGDIDEETVDEVTEASPLFATSFWQPSNNGFSHKYKVVKDITAAAAVDLNGAYPTVGADFELLDRDMAFFAGRREVHVNTVDQLSGGSLDTYLDEEMPLVHNETLQNISFDFYYNVLLPFAKEKSKVVSAVASPSGSIYYSLHFVRWQKGQMAGLVNDKWAQANGGVFKATPLSNGNRYVSGGKSVYGVDIEMPLGFLPANGDNVASIVNIDLATIDDAVFMQLIMDAIISARPGKGGKLVAYANPFVISRIMTLDQAQTVDNVANNGVNSVLMGGVEFIGDWILLTGTEAPYTV